MPNKKNRRFHALKVHRNEQVSNDCGIQALIDVLVLRSQCCIDFVAGYAHTHHRRTLRYGTILRGIPEDARHGDSSCPEKKKCSYF